MTCIPLLAALLLAQASPDPLADARRALEDSDLSKAELLGGKALAESPQSAPVHTFLGQLHLRQGLIGDAEKELRKAIGLDNGYAPAWFELSRVLDLASMHHTAEIYLLKACELAPENETYKRALARVRWPREHPEQSRLTSEYAHSAIPFELMIDGRRLRAFGLAVSINGGKPIRLVLDTGSGGILLRTKGAEKAGLQKLADTEVGGIGDKGHHDAWIARANQVRIGSVTFADYPVEVTDKNALGDEDGLIGTDVFEDFMVTLDFVNLKLLVDPLPGGMPDRKRTSDYSTAPELKGFSPVFRLGHTLLIKTVINDNGPFLFVIDTGSQSSLISKKVAKSATKVYLDSDTVVKGLSGKVKEVSRANELTVQFANFRQKNYDMVTFDLDGISRGDGIEVGGLLGLPLLNMFRAITIDYRDGLVKFDYKPR